MATYHNLIDGPLDPKYANFIRQLQESHSNSGGDLVDFPEFLASQGITTAGTLVKVDENAEALINLLKD